MTKPVFLKSLIILFSFTILFSCSPAISTAIIAKPAEPVLNGRIENDILVYVNRHRNAMGLASLQISGEATLQAYTHSKNMALGKTAFGHDGFDKRIAAIKTTAGWISASAENVAYGQLSAAEVVKGWLNSPGHKKNIEGNYALTGIGIYKDKKGITWFTQIFFRK